MVATEPVATPPTDDPADTVLPRVLHGAPAAVLVVDLDRRQVVSANPAAAALTGERLRLPVGVDAWSAAAGLADASGPSPLARLADGDALAGEPVLVPPDAGGEGRLLWLTGCPLAAGPAGRQALAVFLQLASPEGDRRRLALLRDRAVIATEMSFTITDPHLPDHPLVWVNPSFTRLTGYRFDEVVGRNCRFLQGPNTDPAAVARLGAALRARRPITEVLLNHRRDGTAFWNQLSVSPVLDAAGEVVNFVGVQNDVTERVLVEQDRRAALADAEEARARLRLLAEATTQMTEARDVADACARLARIAVPELADLCAVDLPEQPGPPAHRGPVRRVAVAARDVADERRLREFGGRRAARRGPDTTRGVLDGGAPVLIAELPGSGADRYPDDPVAAELFEGMRPRSAMVVPLRARGRVLGALTLATQHPYGRRYGQHDLHLAADLAGRAGLAVDNVRLYELEHAAAVTLQRSLLPVVPEVAGLQVAARYAVGVDGNQVGGDWYDVLPLSDGAVGIAVGDVVGHDLGAAAAMGQLRAVVRSYAFGGDAPGSVLDRCDQLVQGLEMAALATAVYARLDPPGPDGVRVLHYANAGHPAPLLRTAAGGLVRLDGHRSPMIGVVPTTGAGRGAARVRCAPGSVLLLHTDGLTDLPGADADERTALLERTLAGVPVGASAEAVVESVLAACMPEQPGDDVALLAVRLDDPGGS